MNFFCTSASKPWNDFRMSVGFAYAKIFREGAAPNTRYDFQRSTTPPGKIISNAPPLTAKD